MSSVIINRRICLHFIITILLFSAGCAKKMTVEEFKDKYKWERTVVTTGKYYRNSFTMKYQYGDQFYNTSVTAKPTQDVGDQYWILIDVNDPRSNYLILWHEPIKPTDLKQIIVFKSIEHIGKSNADYFTITYSYSVSGVSYKRIEFVRAEFYDELVEIKSKNKLIHIDVFFKESNTKGKYIPRPFINLGATLMR